MDGPRTRLLLVCALLATAREASALDAQSVGMGNTGAAYIANGAAIYFNPALLQQTGSYDGTLVLAALSTVLETPIAGPNTGFASASTPFPLFLLGGNYRIDDRLVVGIATYPVAGFGATYKRVLNGEDATLTALAIESAPSASFAITKELAVGVSYRITYSALKTGTPLLSSYQEQSVSGLNFLGAQVGILYRPVEQLRLGFSYRSKIATELTGTTTLNGVASATSGWLAWPYSFRFGAAYAPSPALLFAVDLSYSMFSEANRYGCAAGMSNCLTITEQFAAGPKTLVTPLDWVDAISVGVGAQYFVRPDVPLRLGYGAGRTETGDAAASYFFVPPGLAQRFHAGAGLRLPRWDLDVGGYYQTASKTVADDTIANPGRYSAHALGVSLSATFHVEPEEKRP